MGRGDLSDAAWVPIVTPLPPERGRWERLAVNNQRFLNGMASTFSGGDQASVFSESEVEKLHAKIGQLARERDSIAKSFGDLPW